MNSSDPIERDDRERLGRITLKIEGLVMVMQSGTDGVYAKFVKESDCGDQEKHFLKVLEDDDKGDEFYELAHDWYYAFDDDDGPVKPNKALSNKWFGHDSTPIRIPEGFVVTRIVELPHDPWHY